MQGGRSPTGIEALVEVDFYSGFLFDAALGPDRVLGLLEVSNTDFGIKQIDELYSIESLVSEPTLEAFVKEVLPRVARINV